MSIEEKKQEKGIIAKRKEIREVKSYRFSVSYWHVKYTPPNSVKIYIGNKKYLDIELPFLKEIMNTLKTIEES